MISSSVNDSKAQMAQMAQMPFINSVPVVAARWLFPRSQGCRLEWLDPNVILMWLCHTLSVCHILSRPSRPSRPSSQFRPGREKGKRSGEEKWVRRQSLLWRLWVGCELCRTKAPPGRRARVMEYQFICMRGLGNDIQRTSSDMEFCRML